MCPIGSYTVDRTQIALLPVPSAQLFILEATERQAWE